MAVGGRNPGRFPIPQNILDANATRRDHDSHALPIARFTARAGEWRGISTKAYGKQRISHLDDPLLLDPARPKRGIHRTWGNAVSFYA